jgi:hypothetical protein
MRITIRAITALGLAYCLFFPSARAAQTEAGATSALHLTINYPPASVVRAMFGSLPKDVSVVEVTACNDTAGTLILSGGRVVQALRKSGIQALSRDAAISALQNAEGRTWQSLLLRNATHGMNIVNFLVISKALTVGPVLGNALPSIQALMQAVIPELAKDVPDHQYLNFDRDTLPERMQLSPLDCAAGLMFSMKPAGTPPSEVVVDVPAVDITPAVSASH